MFTGIIQDMGEIKSVDDGAGDARIVVQCAMDLGVTQIGASIACSGCCLTVVEKGRDWFAVDVSGETLSKTTIGKWQKGTRVNLEPSLKMGDELGGHIVSGHVDGLAEVTAITPDGDSRRVFIKVPNDLKHYIATKGSVAIDGVSLTVNEVDGSTFGVNIIPHTWRVTTLGGLHVGGLVHLEIDTLARYVARMLDVYPR